MTEKTGWGSVHSNLKMGIRLLLTDLVVIPIQFLERTLNLSDTADYQELSESLSIR